MEIPLDLQELSGRFDRPEVKALALMGSYSRGEAGPYSDIDLARFVDQRPAAEGESFGDGSYLVEGRLLVVSSIELAQVEEWFIKPEKASEFMAGLRQARPLLDRDGTLAGLQERARAFVWDALLQARADAWASREMVGWIEEVHKALEGLARLKGAGDGPGETIDAVGRLLQARFGLSWGLSRVMQVQRGVLIAGDNSFYRQVAEAVGYDSTWVALRERAFGLGPEPSNLVEQIQAGLQLYVETAALLGDVLRPEDRPLVEATAALIEEVTGFETTR